jgi:hypothetical protein
MSLVTLPTLALLTLALLAAPVAARAPAPQSQPGGVLRFSHREDLPQSFAIHETATNCGRLQDTWVDR